MAASNQLITDVQSAITTGPSATSTANAIAAAGPINDLPGQLQLALTKLKEAKVILAQLNTSVLDAGDGIKTTIANVLLSLV